MSISDISNNGLVTSKGTKIINSNSSMDKNAFLKILSAELSNQDPSNPADSTQYVAQMAQFTSLEQMANLNNTMTFNSAGALVGRMIATSVTDDSGNPYMGVVKSVTQQSGDSILNVLVTDSSGNSTIKQFNFKDVTDVGDSASNNYMNSMSQNTLLLTAASLIGKTAEFSDQDSNKKNYTGVIKGVYVDGSVIKLNIQPSGGTDTVSLPYTDILKVYEA
ncbi:hypothetical protein IAI10_08275 [Clostridium sp. 19966]|uniref:flagellar hook capping FlgD N-terminal domain-containing protein n=1 Tax=Clostridium sp. 19966 TaxID=2768166 RepID=UPI0028DEB75A|nr:flagellar hook capping FlgD N-terminal domain-containing protein [Clostridium sp. 19966]MDT8716651.1 hypothetical protein [Clostridium sp. 19966]